MKRIIQILSEIIFPLNKIVLDKRVSKLIFQDNLIVADVGASGGVDSRWRPIENLIKFILFEPDSRGLPTSTRWNLPVALFSKEEKKVLYLTHFQVASSLFLPNKVRLDDFLNHSCHEIVKKEEIEVATLDNSLVRYSVPNPDFIKVDTEGADLDVLKGSINSLENSVMGIQTEVNFIPKQTGAPFFSDIDLFLRNYGFELFLLRREHWVRNNDCSSLNSQNQLVWGDALYLLTREAFFKRIQIVDDKSGLLAKFVIVILTYNLHDYAMEIVEEAQKRNIVDEELVDGLKKSISSSAKAKGFLVRWFFGLIIFLIPYLFSLVSKKIRGKTTPFMKQRVLLFLKNLLTLFGRSGPYRSCVLESW